MSLSHLPHGIFATPVIGAGRFGWKNKATTRVWFVDGTVGSDGAQGDSPEAAFLTIGRAIAKAGAYDVIYVLDKGLSGTDPNPYQEATVNLAVAYAQNNLAIVGVPHNIYQLYGLQVKGVAGALTTPVLKISAPFCAIENLDFNRGGSTGGGVYFADDGNTTNQAQGSSVYNCHFRNIRGSGTVAASGGCAVQVVGGWYYFVGNCYFIDCRGGVALDSGTSTVKGVTLEDLLFVTDTAANIDVDIFMTGTVTATAIRRCNFNHAKPAYNGGTDKYVKLVGDGMIADCRSAGTGTWGATGGDATIPTTFLMAGNMAELAAFFVARTP